MAKLPPDPQPYGSPAHPVKHDPWSYIVGVQWDGGSSPEPPTNYGGTFNQIGVVFDDGNFHANFQPFNPSPLPPLDQTPGVAFQPFMTIIFLNAGEADALVEVQMLVGGVTVLTTGALMLPSQQFFNYHGSGGISPMSGQVSVTIQTMATKIVTGPPPQNVFLSMGGTWGLKVFH